MSLFHLAGCAGDTDPNAIDPAHFTLPCAGHERLKGFAAIMNQTKGFTRWQIIFHTVFVEAVTLAPSNNATGFGEFANPILKHPSEP